MTSESLRQSPRPGASRMFFQGDTLAFELEAPASPPGSGWVRTNIGHAAAGRDEIIGEVHAAETPLGRDWYDLPMRALGGGRFSLTLGLAEVGHFEAKCFFLPEGGDDPVWPQGPNVSANVKPADSRSAAIIYNAFVRQFGPNKDGRFHAAADPSTLKALDAQGYAVIPPSGTFRALIRDLDFITGVLGCRFIQLLPVLPTPTTYGRMGRFGSPYAALSFTDVDPALAEFDPKATPLDQFLELVDEIHTRDARLLLDIAINHTGWAAGLHGSHPEWLARTAEGAIEKPGAWGVVWEDLTRLDYSRKDLWRYMAEVFLTWCRRGADGFRCDAGYMIPMAAWRYITARVREEYPGTIFLLEGLGGEVEITRRLLARGGFDWAYSELFQAYDRPEIERSLAAAAAMAASDGVPVHFAETHDNNRLAARSHRFAAMRTAMSALLSHHGAFGFANGVEWFATEKIDVHDARSLAWGASPNQVRELGRLARILRFHPAFAHPVEVVSAARGPGPFVAVARRGGGSARGLVVLVNLDTEKETLASWDAAAAGPPQSALYDLLAGRGVETAERDGVRSLLLAPAQVACLSAEASDLEAADAAPLAAEPAAVLEQRLRSAVLTLLAAGRGAADLGDFDLVGAARALLADPVAFWRTLCLEPRLARWRWPEDTRREVMIAPDHLLLVQAPHPFRAEIREGERTRAAAASFRSGDGSHFALLGPLAVPERSLPLSLALSVYAPRAARRERGPLLLLAPARGASIAARFDRNTCLAEPLLLLGTNGRGAMMRARVSWGRLESRYDALLAANLHPEFPVDRQVMLARCRAWVVHQGTSQAVGPDTLDRFGFDYSSRGCWEYRVPIGRGQHIVLSVALEMAQGENLVHIHFHRQRAGDEAGRLEDGRPVRLILRPDVEDRSFHETTKAAAGPERDWPAAVSAGRTGFVFSPRPPRRLEVLSDSGEFVQQGEWQYMVHRPVEEERGMDPDSDLYSPGYFRVPLNGGQTVTLSAQARSEVAEARSPARPEPHWVAGWFASHAGRIPLGEALAGALQQYVARRGSFHTVIAGYPWFLDWGRDTLIVVRGLIAAGLLEQSRDILRQFARFEERGTLPNMIRGDESRDRDTSDAPLWLCVACGDLLEAEGEAVLALDCGGRSLRDVLVSLGRSMVDGAANGVRMDRESGLLFSPAHFTWMDTNYPAGTPREGYPIEIQALWHAALRLLARVDQAGPWAELAAASRVSIGSLFVLPGRSSLSDCLHAAAGTPARAAVRDDCLRPNQLLAISLGAVDDPALQRGILEDCWELLLPGAIRSLADRPVEPPLEIRHNGAVLGDPRRPYRGTYAGDEDTRRKPAYHNGTAWTWLFPSYAEAWARVYGEGGQATARAWLAGATRLIDTGCVGHLPEVLDGDAPHRQRGCDAQAWGASELLRVWLKLGGD